MARLSHLIAWLGFVLSLGLSGACTGPSWAGGVHARFAHSPERGLRTVEVPPGGPAAIAGLREGDLVVAIDGLEVASMDAKAVRERLTGEVGTHVTLHVRRGEQELSLEMERAPYE